MAGLFEDFQVIPEESLVELGQLNVLLENELRERVKKLLEERVEARRKKLHEEAESTERSAAEVVGPYSLLAALIPDAREAVERGKQNLRVSISQEYAKETEFVARWKNRQKELSTLGGSALYDLLGRIYKLEDIQAILDLWPA